MFESTKVSATGEGEVPRLITAAREISLELQRGAQRRDATRQLPQEGMALVRQAGIGAARVPAAYGGAEVSYVTLVQIFLILARGDSNVAQALIPHFTAVERVRLMGSPKQKERYFADVLGGQLIAGGTSERGGKFRTDITTALTPDGDGYRLNGVKFYSTGSLLADQLRVTGLNPAGERVSILLPRNREGVTLHDDWTGMGQRTTASGTSEYRNVRVEADEVIPFGPWEATQRNYGSSAAQLLHAVIDAGIAFAALDDALRWANKGSRPVRESGVQRSVDDPYVQQAIGRISAHAHAAEAILLRAAGLVDAAAQIWHALPGESSSGRDTGSQPVQEACIAAAVAVAEARIVTHEVGLSAGELIYEVAGASATLEEQGFDRHWRNARTHTTHDPVSYKFKVVGDYLLNGAPPPLSLYY
jgi:alkylation response protein AidB-like acyl-CoA dehydrogenase